MKSRVVSPTELKAKCLALLDESMIAATQLQSPSAAQPVKKKSWRSPKGPWIGKVKIVGDMVEFDATHLWDTLR
jgi:hypothetical protein